MMKQKHSISLLPDFGSANLICRATASFLWLGCNAETMAMEEEKVGTETPAAICVSRKFPVVVGDKSKNIVCLSPPDEAIIHSKKLAIQNRNLDSKDHCLVTALFQSFNIPIKDCNKNEQINVQIVLAQKTKNEGREKYLINPEKLYFTFQANSLLLYADTESADIEEYRLKAAPKTQKIEQGFVFLAPADITPACSENAAIRWRLAPPLDGMQDGFNFDGPSDHENPLLRWTNWF